jgi:hypothetical protein
VARSAPILPPYFCTILVFWAASEGGSPNFRQAPGQEVLSSLTLRIGHGHFWTIPIKVHYYLVFVLLWAVCQRFGIKVFAAVAVSVAGLLFLLATALASQGPVNPAILIFWAPFFVLGTLIGAGGEAWIHHLRVLQCAGGRWRRASRWRLRSPARRTAAWSVRRGRSFAGSVATRVDPGPPLNATHEKAPRDRSRGAVRCQAGWVRDPDACPASPDRSAADWPATARRLRRSRRWPESPPLCGQAKRGRRRPSAPPLRPEPWSRSE